MTQAKDLVRPAVRGALADKVVLVTGGSRGIGRAIVEVVCSAGARTALTYQSRKDDAERVVRQMADAGSEAVAIQADIRDYKRTQDVVAQTLERFGRLDGLVNNAGITRDKAFMMMSPKDWQDVIDTNLTGTFNACRATVVMFMKQRCGRIVNVTSVAGLMGAERQVNYAASKAGIIGLTRSLAKEVAPYGVTVNAVAPGYIETEMTSMVDPERLEAAKNRIPVGRIGSPPEVALLTAYLLSDAAAYITGQTVVIDGGLTL